MKSREGSIMFRSLLLHLSLAGSLLAQNVSQDPFQPLNLDAAPGTPDLAGARRNWVTLTNKRMEMTGSTLRVGIEGDGLTVVVLAKGVEKPRHAKPILQGKGDYKGLFQEIVGQRFNRIVVRNPDTRQQWAARLEKGKAILED